MIIAGIGCRANCPATDIIVILRQAEAQSGLRATAIAIPAFKSEEPGLLTAAQTLNLPLHEIEDDALAEAQSRCVTRSERTQAATGHASIAEAAALAAAGPRATLKLPRIKSSTATCALAESSPS